MIIAVASGKGGTGKTTVAVGMALSLKTPVQLLDCDVEEPNSHIFLSPAIDSSIDVAVRVPVVDEVKCTACGECARFCQYNAIVSLKTAPLIFAEMCHGCGGCALVCPEGAITETTRSVGVIESGHAGAVLFASGRLNVGEAMSPPVIRATKALALADRTVIIDCPPGTSCPMITAVRGSDYCVLVTEPTPFGLNDLILAVETCRKLGVPFGVVVNRAGCGDDRVQAFCAREDIPVLLEIPDDRRIAEAYSCGKHFVEALPEYRHVFAGLLGKILAGDIA